MRKEELQLLENIDKIQNKQSILLQKCKTEQQKFLHIFGQRHLLSKKMLHKNIQQTLTYLKGTFGHLELQLKYVTFCLQNNVELDPNSSPLVKLLINWTQDFPNFKNEKFLSLTKLILQIKEINNFRSIQEYIVYLNIIGPDIMNIVCRPNKEKEMLTNLSSSPTSNWSFDHFNHANLLSLVNYSLPKILINILLPNNMIPPQLKQQIKIIQCLYKNASLQYFIRTNNQYGSLIMKLIKILINFEWKQTEQKILMDIVFRYYYAFHYDQKYKTATIFVEAYNKLSQQTISDFADQFILFFRIIRKIGKSKFVDFILDKSKILNSIVNKKTNEIDKIGQFKDNINPFNLLGLVQDITIGNGKKEIRTFQVLSDHSVIYFKIVVISLDVTIRLYYLGDITKSNQEKTLIMQRIKKEGIFSTNIIAIRKGLYMFEFDNSYSWMNKKIIKYQNVVLSPLEIQATDKYKWIDSYYGGIKPIQITNKQNIWIIKQQQPTKTEEKYNGTVNITKNQLFFNMKIVFKKEIYQFQSENAKFFMQKVNEVNRNKKIKWMIADKPIKDVQSIENFVFDKNPSTQTQNKAIKNKERIDSKYEEQEEQAVRVNQLQNEQH